MRAEITIKRATPIDCRRWSENKVGSEAIIGDMLILSFNRLIERIEDVMKTGKMTAVNSFTREYLQ